LQEERSHQGAIKAKQQQVTVQSKGRDFLFKEEIAAVLSLKLLFALLGHLLLTAK
jgi:hypothetical protein